MGRQIAREPGAGPALSSYASLGVPIGIAPPPGIYGKNSIGFGDVDSYDANGNKTGDSITSGYISQQIIWVPGWEIFGAQYEAFVTGAVVNVDLDSPTLGDHSRLGFSDVEIHPIDLNWKVSDELHIGFGFSVFAPLGSYNQKDTVNTGRNYWSINPSIGATYQGDSWSATVHALYFKELKNTDTDYHSGDEFVVNFAAWKDVGAFSVGPVGYWRKQVQADRNEGTFYGGTTAGKVEEMGLGIGFAKQFKSVTVQAFYTHELKAENTTGGDHFFTNIVYPF